MWIGFKEYTDRLEWVHASFERVLAGLPQEALDWTPGPGMNSLAVLAAHCAGSERYWIGDIAVQQPSGRDRDAEFRTRGVGGPELIAWLNGVLDYSRATVERLAPADLDIVRPLPGEEKTRTVAWCLAHALEHIALHLGHMEITRQLWEQRGGRE